jgi:hypothetical protein
MMHRRRRLRSRRGAVEAGLFSAADFVTTLAICVSVGLTVGLSIRIMRLKLRDAARGQAGAPDAAVEIERIRAKDRADARALYERVTRDKLDVIKTAITMGYSKQDLAELDARLEQLIGTDKLQALSQEPGAPPPLSSQLLDQDLAQELADLKQHKQRQAQ